jgi:hypothetical protein
MTVQINRTVVVLVFCYQRDGTDLAVIRNIIVCGGIQGCTKHCGLPVTQLQSSGSGSSAALCESRFQPLFCSPVLEIFLHRQFA